MGFYGHFHFTLNDQHKYLQSLLRISNVLSDSSDLDRTFRNLMAELLDIFGSDRAWLLYPCDLKAEYITVPVEATNPAYPGMYSAGGKFRSDPDVVASIEEVLAVKGPVIQDFDESNIPEPVKDFSIKTQMVIALYPKEDMPWMLGMHQCSHRRSWSEEDKKLFNDISVRVTDMLTQRLLLTRVENELRLRQEVQDELVRAKEEAEKASKAKSDFLSVISHELRTPLTSIQGALGLVLGKDADGLSSDVKHMLEIAHRNGERLVRLINDLLDISKIESGMMEVKLDRYELRDLLHQSIEAIGSYTANSHINITLNVPEQSIYAAVDPGKFSQVVANLVSNASKFSPPESRVDISLASDHRHARILVKDYGIGIADDFKPYVFEKFLQYDATDSRKQNGAGLGLAISKYLVTKMNGEIGFTSTPGKGSEFYFELPVC